MHSRNDNYSLFNQPVNHNIARIKQGLITLSNKLGSNTLHTSLQSIPCVNLLETNFEEYNEIVREFRELFEIAMQPQNKLWTIYIIKLSFLYLMFSSYIHHWVDDAELRMKDSKEKLAAITEGSENNRSLDLIALEYMHQYLEMSVKSASYYNYEKDNICAHQQLLMINENLFGFLTNIRKTNKKYNVNYSKVALSFPIDKLIISRRITKAGRAQQFNNKEDNLINKLSSAIVALYPLRAPGTIFIEDKTSLELDYPIQIKEDRPGEVAITIEMDGPYHYYENTKAHKPIHHIKTQSLLNLGIVRVPVNPNISSNWEHHTPVKASSRFDSSMSSNQTQETNYQAYLNNYSQPTLTRIANQLNNPFVSAYYIYFYYPLLNHRYNLRNKILMVQQYYRDNENQEIQDLCERELEQLFVFEDRISALINKRILEHTIIKADIDFQLQMMTKFAETLISYKAFHNQCLFEMEALNKVLEGTNNQLKYIQSLIVQTGSTDALLGQQFELVERITFLTARSKQITIDCTQNNLEYRAMVDVNKGSYAMVQNYFCLDLIENLIQELDKKLEYTNGLHQWIAEKNNSIAQNRNSFLNHNQNSNVMQAQECEEVKPCSSDLNAV